MGAFDIPHYEHREAERELEEFECLLSTHAELGEREHILPAFRRWRSLCTLIGSLHSKVSHPDRVRSEFNLDGYFQCDLLVGNSLTRSYCFVEFEDARPSSIFSTQRRRLPVWSKRFNNGYNQLLDWFWLYGNRRNDPIVRGTFGAGHLSVAGILVIGRDHSLDEVARDRWEWRAANADVQGGVVLLHTYDSLLAQLRFNLALRAAVPQVRLPAEL